MRIRLGRRRRSSNNRLERAALMDGRANSTPLRRRRSIRTLDPREKDGGRCSISSSAAITARSTLATAAANAGRRPKDETRAM